MARASRKLDRCQLTAPMGEVQPLPSPIKPAICACQWMGRAKRVMGEPSSKGEGDATESRRPHEEGLSSGGARSTHFGPFTLDRSAARLWRGREAIALRPKTWAVLVHLVERPGVLVSGDELLDAIWTDVAVTPGTLTKSIGELRRVFGDDARQPRFIETVSRRGFRFVAATSAVPISAAFGDELGPPSTSPTAGDPVLRRESLVGRETELRRLGTAFARACAGKRQIAFVTGPAGIGKTALVKAFLRHVAARPHELPVLVAEGASIDNHGPREAYLPVLEALNCATRGRNGERIVEKMRTRAPMWLLQMPWLIGGAEAESLRLTLQSVSAARMLREFVALVEALTSESVLLLVLEDLHWSDPSTVDLLSLLAQHGELSRLLVIATYRPAEAAAAEHVLSGMVRGMRARRQCEEIALHDLEEVAVGAYLESRFPGANFPPQLARRIFEHTDGHPLFLVAAVDHLRSCGRIVETDPGWAVAEPPEAIRLDVPDDIRDMVVAQFHGLASSDRGLLEAASAAGTRFAPQAVAAALGAASSDTETACEALARARRFLRAAGPADWPDGSIARQYAFTHDLYRQIVYDEVPEGRRAGLHQRIGEALEKSYGERVAEVAPSLAEHFERSGDTRRALRALKLAAEGARQRFAAREAIGFYGTGLALVGRLAEERERMRAELELRLLLGGVLADFQGFASERVRENYERSSALCAAVGSDAELFQTLYARWYLHAIRAEVGPTLSLADELAALADRVGTPAALTTVASVRVRTALYRGRFCEVRCLMEEWAVRRAAGEDVGAPISYGVDPWLAASAHYGSALALLGLSEMARQRAAENIARARESHTASTLAAVLAQAAQAALFRQDAAEAERLAGEAASLSAERGLRFWAAVAQAVQGWAWMRQGRLLVGSAEVERALAALRATGARLFTNVVLAFHAESCLVLGKRAEGLEATREALEFGETALDCGYAPELWRLRGELLLSGPSADAKGARSRPRAREETAGGAQSILPEGERSLRRALEMARAAEAMSFELRAATSLARAQRASRRTAEARQLLAETCIRCEAAGSSADMREARQLLDELTARPRARSA